MGSNEMNDDIDVDLSGISLMNKNSNVVSTEIYCQW